MYLEKGDRASVAVYSPDYSWRINTESGFSCHMFATKSSCDEKITTVKPPVKPPVGTPPIMDGNLTPPQFITKPPIEPPKADGGLIVPPVMDGFRGPSPVVGGR